MALREEFEQSGNWLFRWRSYLPAALVVLLFVGMQQFHYLGDRHLYQEWWSLGCLCVSFCGLAVRAKVVGHTPKRTSGRNTLNQVAESLNTSGMYSVVRHPLYLGNYLIWLGFSLFCLLWWVVVIFSLTLWLYYERIMFAEEEFLRRKFGDEFVRWSAVTPAFLPRLRNWRRPSLPFSLRNVLRREYTALFGIVAAFTGLEFVEHLVVEHRVILEPWWAAACLAALAAFIGLRFLKRHTNLLKVDGR